MNASREEFRAAREPTGPAPVSLWRMLRGDKADPLERWLGIQREHGAVARYRYGPFDTFFISDAEGVRRVLQENVPNYTKDHPSYAMIRRLVGNGLLTSEGGFWLRQRRLAQPAFHRERIAAMAEAMTAAALETADGWERLASGGEPFSMLKEMSKLTLRIVGHALFGTGLEERAARVGASWDVLNRQMLERFDAMRLLPPILPTRYDREFREARRAMLQVVDEIIAARRAGEARDRGDLLSMLMAARDEESGEGMTDAQLRDEVVTMVLAGHETTAITLAWVWALLDADSGVRERLDHELQQVLGGRAPTAADVPKLVWTRAVIDETLRLFPPAYILNRRVLADDVVCGHRVHAKGVVVITPLVLHRHPGYWERPEVFQPERFLDADAEQRRPRFAYMPFSGGPRQCIGNNFALLEAVLVLATLAQRFRATLVDDRLPDPEYLTTMRPKGGVPMRLARQSSPSRA